ncbi:MAG: 23S rRNA (guanosine(2251)-2'-O)-methyltransferase RlmB [Tepidanaerobacteraceae bacterium]|nr:23S rRNA (guanosine(2251)-2'-O)-methyltransferase RlmB [Tepidanaerobacteraceae bacterium]
MLQVLPKKQLKLIRNLKRSKNIRIKNQCFFVEGLKNVSEALKSDHEIKFIVISEDFSERNTDFLMKLSKNTPQIRLYEVPNAEYDKITDTVTPQGILAVIGFKDVKINDILRENFMMIALDRINDPGNMGTIIRTADAAGASGVIIGKGCVDVYNPKVVRSAMGSLFHVPLLYTDDIMATLSELRKKGSRVITTHLKAKKIHYEVDFTDKIVIVMGDEDEGVSDEIVHISDEVVKIPMPGEAESLNVAIAFGIMAFEAVRQRI